MDEFIKNLPTIIIACGTFIGSIVIAFGKFINPAIDRLVSATVSQTNEIQKIGLALTVQQERFDAHQKTTEHNFRQIRTALESLTQRPACEFDPTSATEVHEAAQKQLRTSRAT